MNIQTIWKGFLMMLKAVFFDLDGTLLPLNEEEFLKLYFSLLANKLAPYGFLKEELIKTIWEGTNAMYKNNGSMTNEEVFWQTFLNHYHLPKETISKLFDEFYTTVFPQTIKATQKNTLAKEIITFCQKEVPYVLLTTNPLFPQIATETRMGFIDLALKDFNFVTTYENSSFCKPNPAYFQALLAKFNLKPEEVILFGNNDLEDYLCAMKAGIKCYLLEDNLIAHEELKLKPTIIKMHDVIPIIKQEIALRK